MDQTDTNLPISPRIDCPACRSSATQHVFTVSAEEAAQHFVLREEYPERNRQLLVHIKCLWSKDTCDIRKCTACGFGFADPFVAGDALFYNLAYPKVNYPTDKWEYSATADALRARAELPIGNVLDVGAGFGSFLDKIKPLLIPSQKAIAIEYNEHACGILRQKGYQVFQNDLRSDAFSAYETNFAYIFMFQVVEHMDELERLFERIRYLLTPDGSAFIAVPNTTRTDFQEQTGSLIDMPPNHIGRFSTDSFNALARRTGLAIVSEQIEPFTMRKFAKVDLKFLHLRRAQRSGSLANRIRSLPNSKRRLAMEAMLALAWAPVRTPVMLAAHKRRDQLGDSLLIEVSRAS